MAGTRVNDEQATLWNSSAGRAWVEAQELLDHVFNPLEKLLVQAVARDTEAQHLQAELDEVI